MKHLRVYQKEAVDKIYDFLNSDKTKAKMYISNGLGKTTILVSAIERLLADNKNTSIAILERRIALRDQIKSQLQQLLENIEIASSVSELVNQRLLVTTYQDAEKNNLDIGVFSLLILDEADRLNREDFSFLLRSGRTKYLGVLSAKELSDGWLSDAICLFSYTMKDAVRDGYGVQGSEKKLFEQFVLKLLEFQGYGEISEDVEIRNAPDYGLRFDFSARKGDELLLIEVKNYRNLNNSKVIVDNALKRFLMYQRLLNQKGKEKRSSMVLIMPCEIEDQIQKEILEQHNIIIWDINNLIYMCGDNKELLNLLMSCIPFSSLSLTEKKPLEAKDEINQVVLEEVPPSMVEKYQEKLEKCKMGKEDQADKQYENICTEIIKYLFETEFYKVSEQHKTDDQMFRMDLLCSLKGTTEFWRFLINFYRTKFVVFEYKNYSDYISQNLIYTTEKYLFPVALRNVAFIISRRGFDSGAHKTAIGCLRENGKLIVSLNDEDLITMIAMKENGEEPSDFLLNRVEDILMSVSK